MLQMWELTLEAPKWPIVNGNAPGTSMVCVVVAILFFCKLVNVDFLDFVVLMKGA
jgi:hypothetical protein